MYSRFAAFLEGGVECFDAAAFRLPRPEAVALDPQARLLLEHSWVRALVACLGPASAHVICSEAGPHALLDNSAKHTQVVTIFAAVIGHSLQLKVLWLLSSSYGTK